MLILILTLCGSYAGLATLIISLSVLLDKWYNKESKQWLALRLKEGVHQNPETWLKTINQTFLDLFDHVFSARESIVEQGIWLGLLLSPMMLAGIRIPLLIGLETPIEDKADSLLFAISLAFSVSLGVVIGRTLIARGINIGTPILSGFILASFIIIGIYIAYSVNFIVGALPLGFSIGLNSSIAIGTKGLIASGVGIGIPIIMGSVIRGLSTVGTVIATVIGAAITIITVLTIRNAIPQEIHISAHPLRALASSLFFIILVGIVASLIRTDAASSLLNTINQQGIKVLAFVAFNIFGDAVSLIETRWVLQRGSSATVVQLLGLLALDLVASAAIFLFLPAVIGEITTFWDAVLLRGDRPWLGILFWSTFGTSVIFYLFVIASLLVHPLIPLLRGVAFLSRDFKLEEYPFGFIALSLCLILTLIFAIGGLVALIAS